MAFIGLTRQHPGLPRHEVSPLPGDGNPEAIDATPPDPVWLLICHDEGLYASKLAQLKVSDLNSDQALFSALHNEYITLRGKWQSKISFRKIKAIKFVGLEMHHGDFVDVRPKEDIPPTDNTNYIYHPAPADLTPPIEHRHLMHLF
jgi:hypothetical protein